VRTGKKCVVLSLFLCFFMLWFMFCNFYLFFFACFFYVLWEVFFVVIVVAGFSLKGNSVLFCTRDERNTLAYNFS
jgi:hypothetical protein